MKIKFYDPDEEDVPVRRSSKKKGFTMNWVSELGWRNNPFQYSDLSIAGFEEERKEINLFFVKRKGFGVIKGKEGLGHSTILKWLYSELKDYKDIQVHFVDAGKGTDVDFIEHIYKPFRGMFGSKLPDNDEELISAVRKKAKGRFVLLVDNSENLEDVGWGAIEALLKTDCSVIVATTDERQKIPLTDDLGLSLNKPSVETYMKMLEDRISSVGGKGIRPFSEDVVKRMAKETDTIKEFLELAEETAINIALKKATLEDDVSEEEIADDQERRVQKKKGISAPPDKEDKKAAKKREYDELIESLTEGMD